MRSRNRAFAVLSLVSLLTAASRAPASDDNAAVIARVNAYFHALGAGDTAALRASVTTANAFAYITYENHGVTTPGLWLESAVLHRAHGAWRIAFMHSTRMSSAPAAGLAEWRSMGPSGMEMMRLVGTDSPTEMAAFRVRYPAGFKIDSGVHYHLGTEHVVVLKGTVLVGFGDTADYSKVTAYGPGSFIVIPAGVHHYEMFRGEVEANVEHVGPMTTVWLTHAGSPGPLH
jgi:quercetin dioxygenase-like cupin family protein